MTGELGSCVEANTGQIMCNAYFQVTNQHPFIKSKDGPVLASPATFENIFAVGDVALTPTIEVKSIVSIVQTAKFCYGNVEAHLFGTPMTPVPERLHELLMMACGKSYGWFVFNGACFEKEDASATKLSNSKKAHDQWVNPPAALQEIKEKTLMPEKINDDLAFAMKSGCECLPMHINKVKEGQDERLSAKWQKSDQAKATKGME
jgi:hypothetical protein